MISLVFHNKGKPYQQVLRPKSIKSATKKRGQIEVLKMQNHFAEALT